MTKYFHKAASGQRAGLKTFTRTSEGIVVHGLWHEEGADYITVCTYDVAEQVDKSVEQYFNRRVNTVETSEGIMEVWMPEFITTPTTADAGDFLLYRYRAGSEEK